MVVGTARDAGRLGETAALAEYGLLAATVGEGSYDLDGIEEDLGKRWAIADPGLSVKPYPACTSTLRAVDAMLRIATSADYHADAVQRVVAHVHPDLLHTLRFRAPTEGFRGKSASTTPWRRQRWTAA